MSRERDIESDFIIKIRGSRKQYLFIYLMIIVLIIVISFIKLADRYLDKYVLIGSIVFIVVAIKGTEVHRLNNYYEITSHYMVHSKGLVKNDIKRIFIPTISDIVLKQNPWQRLLNYGTLLIHRYTPGAIIEVKNINSPVHFMNLLEEKMNRGGGR